MHTLLLGHAAEEVSANYGVEAWIEEEFKAETGYSREPLKPGADLSGVEVLAFWHSEPDYEESCWVLFRKGGELYEVNGSHCSCYGYEGQWEPTKTSVTYLLSRHCPFYYRGDEGDITKLKELLTSL